MPDTGIIPFPRVAIQKIMDVPSEQDITRVAREVAESNIGDIALIMKGDHDLESYKDVFRSWRAISNFVYREKEEEGKSICIVQHNMGKKFSLFLEQLLAAILTKMTKGRFEFQTTNDFVVTEIHNVNS
jgi:hypothetical protein